MENVDHCHVEWDDEHVFLQFTDVFGNGDEYGFTAEAWKKIIEKLEHAISKQKRGQ